LSRPDPHEEIRLVSLRALRGPSFWSTRPVVRMDVAVGAYDEISSADVPRVADLLLDALPGLVEHRCSVGSRGGFVERLRRGTYAPHIAEHVGLELQSAIGHEVGYGRARGGDRPGEYTVVLEHRHSAVGMRAAARALEVVRRAFAGTLGSLEGEVDELRGLAATGDAPPLEARVLCGVTGGGDLAAFRRALAARREGSALPVVELTPAYLLDAGLPYARSEIAVVLDERAPGVPPRYAEPAMAARLLSVVADGVPPGGFVVAPEGAAELHALIHEAGRRVAPFAPDGDAAATAAAVAARLLGSEPVEDG
jgi:hypothetical protein